MKWLKECRKLKREKNCRPNETKQNIKTLNSNRKSIHIIVLKSVVSLFFFLSLENKIRIYSNFNFHQFIKPIKFFLIFVKDDISYSNITRGSRLNKLIKIILESL